MRFQMGDFLEFLQQCVLGVLVHSELVLDLLGSVGKAWFWKGSRCSQQETGPSVAAMTIWSLTRSLT